MDLAHKILSKMSDNLTLKEEARFIYIELGKELSFSTKFNNTTVYNIFQMLKMKVDVTNLTTKQVNCAMWAQLYSQLLNMVGIENKIVGGLHKYVEFYIDGKRMIADATACAYNDLARIKNGDDTIRYGYGDSNDIVFLTKEIKQEFNQIDDKIGYNNDKRKKLIELKQNLNDIKNKRFDIKKILPNENITEENELLFKLEYLFYLIGKLNDGYYESKEFVHYLEFKILNENEIDKIDTIELKRTNKDESVDIIQCICVKNDNNYHYYLLAPNLPVQKFEPYQIQSLVIRGYGIGKKKIPGIDYPKQFVVGKISKGIQYHLHRQARIFKILKPKEIDLYADQTFKAR